MRVVDLIELKRDGKALPRAEVRGLFRAFLAGEVEDYQLSALLMAIFFRGMEGEELVGWTEEMMRSGDTFDFSHLPGHKVDKHSTGGVGDKVSLPLAPLLGACGLVVPMISGRGLGHTGGTLDKLESVAGFNTQQSAEGFERLLREVGVGLIGQTPSIVPVDRKLYALRDVTATVPSVPLIASSIMSKKLAEGSERLVLDVKVGRGAFMRTRDDARLLAQTCIRLGHGMGRDVRALLTQMDQPLGVMVGNALEVRETLDVLRGAGPADTRALTLRLAEELLAMCGLDPTLARERLDSGAALARFYDVVAAHGGDRRAVEDPRRLPTAPHRAPLLAPRDGYVSALDALKVGHAAVVLGAGRAVASDAVDPRVGFELVAKVGDRVARGEPLAWVEHAERGYEEAAAELLSAYEWSDEPVPPPALIYERVTVDGAAPYAPLC
ncbi:MAG: thymidine phosphorylase [Deltaproteobacteria bacterium]|nr:thymidine phosphorylase [Deltaproteobacteria bacterium]